MINDHPFSQRNRTTERTVGLEVGDNREVGERGTRGWTKFETERGGKQYMGVFVKKGG